MRVRKIAVDFLVHYDIVKVDDVPLRRTSTFRAFVNSKALFFSGVVFPAASFFIEFKQCQLVFLLEVHIHITGKI